MAFEAYSKLPKEIFVKWAESSDDPYLDASEDIEDTVDHGDIVTVGIYKLIAKKRVSTQIVVK